MDESRYDEHRAKQMKIDLEELGTANMIHESQNTGRLHYHAAIHLLHIKTLED